MRKHSVRKFIHAVLDCLPLMVIPIFAIYSQNHEINDNTLQVQENIEINNFNQRWKFSENVNFTILQSYEIEFDNVQLNTYWSLPNGAVWNQNDKYLLTYELVNSNNGTFYSYMDYDDNIDGFYQYQANVATQKIVSFTQRAFSINVATANNFNGTFKVNLFDLTAMFGDDLPTIAEFNLLFPNYFYDYVLTETAYVEGYTTTYDDTDIMSQFMYVTYNACDKYFNMNKVFNLGNIWNWVQNTLFNGSAPLSAFIVYNVIAYEFIMDIIFLVYEVFMFIIDFAENCLDNAFYKSKRGISR